MTFIFSPLLTGVAIAAVGMLACPGKKWRSAALSLALFIAIGGMARMVAGL
jgi:hypothetical protein